uniref:Uncharacterized protein n=1 Tax=Arundo donax TaxID=35708 RepID=A0A0A9C5I6_ARUDO
MRGHGDRAVHLRGIDVVGEGCVRAGDELHGPRRLQAGHRLPCPHPRRCHGQPDEAEEDETWSDRLLLGVRGGFVWSNSQYEPVLRRAAPGVVVAGDRHDELDSSDHLPHGSSRRTRKSENQRSK